MVCSPNRRAAGRLCLNVAVADFWRALLPLVLAGSAAAWWTRRRAMPSSDGSVFLLALVCYATHQVEEHLWPGGFRAWTNRHMFGSADPARPIGAGAIALVNVGIVWVPFALAAAFPGRLRALGDACLGAIGVNGLLHCALAVRERRYNPGAATAATVFVPLSGWYLARRAGREGTRAAAATLLRGALIHAPVGAIFGWDVRRSRRVRT